MDYEPNQINFLKLNPPPVENSSVVQEIYDEFGIMKVRSVQSKHIPHDMHGKRAIVFDKLAEKVGYKNSRIGKHQGLSHQKQDIEKAHAIASGPIRPVKYVITKDNRIWADNTHGALAWLIKGGLDIRIKDTTHYFIDLRREVPLVINCPQTLVMPNLEVSINNAIKIQKRLDKSWRPMRLSFTIGELFIFGRYSRK